MRVKRYKDLGDNDQAQRIDDFAKWLLQVGEKKLPVVKGKWGVQVRSDLCAEGGVDGLLAWVYKGLSEKVGTDAWPGWVSERCVLAPKNIDVTADNDGMVDALPGEDIVLRSSNRVTEERYTSKVGEEHLNQRIQSDELCTICG